MLRANGTAVAARSRLTTRSMKQIRALPPAGQLWINVRTGWSAAGAGSVSPTVFPASGLVGLGGREPVAEGYGEALRAGFHRMARLALREGAWAER